MYRSGEPQAHPHPPRAPPADSATADNPGQTDGQVGVTSTGIVRACVRRARSGWAGLAGGLASRANLPGVAGQTDGQTDGQIDGQIECHIDGQALKVIAKTDGLRKPTPSTLN